LLAETAQIVKIAVLPVVVGNVVVAHRHRGRGYERDTRAHLLQKPFTTGGEFADPGHDREFVDD